MSDVIKAWWHRLTVGAANKNAAQVSKSADRLLVFGLTQRRRLPTAKQMAHVSKYLSPRESGAVKLLLVLMATSLVVMGGKLFTDRTERVPGNGGTYEEAAVGQPRLINPVLATGNDVDLDLIKLIYSGLVRTDERGGLVPDLASSIDVSTDDKTYTAHLLDGVTWHDGQPFTASDVVATIGYVKNPGWKSPFAGQFKNVEVRADGDQTVIFTLQEPFAPFLSLLTIGILPEHLWRDIKPESAARAELNMKPIGTGPFKFKSLIKDKKGNIKSYVLSPNDEHHRHAPYLSSLSFSFFTDFASAAEALRTRKVDGISFLPLELRKEIGDVRAARAVTLKLPQYTAIFFNPKKNAALLDKNVRLSLAGAIDREAIVRDVLNGNAEVAQAPIPPGFIGYDTEAKSPAHDPAQAVARLEKAGWKLDGDGLRKKDALDAKGKVTGKTTLAMTVVTVDTKEHMAVAQAVKDAWQGIGVQVELNIVPASRLQKDVIRPRNYDALIYGEIVGSDPDPYPFWHSSQANEQGLNLAMFTDRRADELLEKARRTSNADERSVAYKEFQGILMNEGPAVFLYRPTYVFAMSRKIKGFKTETVFAPADRFTDVSDWYVQTDTVWKR